MWYRVVITLLLAVLLGMPGLAASPHQTKPGGGKGKGGKDAEPVFYNAGVLEGVQLDFAPLRDQSVSIKEKPALKPEELVVRGGRSETRTFLLFDVTGIDRPVVSARLLLRSMVNSSQGGDLRPVETDWPEVLTWQDQPQIDFSEPPLASVARVGNDGYYEWDVGEVVTGDDVYAFGLTCDGCSGAYASSDAAEYRPYLVVVLEDAPVDPDPGGFVSVLVGAGDIASCPTGPSDPLQSSAERTAQLLDAIEGEVFTAGDNSQGQGSPDEYLDCYDPTWGRHKSRTWPAPGNHDYMTSGASGYFDYFGAVAHPPEGYYSYDLGSWHVVSLNTACEEIGGCGPGSPMQAWLEADLAGHLGPCAAAYMHRPRFSSGRDHGSDEDLESLVELLYSHGVDVLVTGHDHLYERFAPQDPTGLTDLEHGIRMFVAGTGGAGLDAFLTPVANSEARSNLEHGVLKLTLFESGYEWAFVGVGGSFIDFGGSMCR